MVVEAEHFDYRNYEFTDAAVPHHFHIVPDEDGATTPEHPWGDTHSPDFMNARGKYLQILPEAGANNGNCPTCPNENVGFPPYAEYKVEITTLGTYQLYLRQVGFDGGSDSFFAQILEFAPPGPGPNFYRYAPNPDTADFAALRNIPFDATTENQGWSGYAEAAPVVNGGDNNAEKPALYNITTPGLYSIRMSQREDGSAVDAFILQLASLRHDQRAYPILDLVLVGRVSLERDHADVRVISKKALQMSPFLLKPGQLLVRPAEAQRLASLIFPEQRNWLIPSRHSALRLYSNITISMR